MKFAALVAVLAVGLSTLAGCSDDEGAVPVATATVAPTALATSTPSHTNPPPSRTPTPTSTIGLPDLVPAGAMLFAEPPPEGCTRDPSEIPTPVLIVCVENHGSGPAGAFTVSATGTSEFGPLAAGERACATTAGATRGIQVEVDVGNRVAESDETNNGASYFVGVVTPPMMCTITPTPTPTGVPLGRCSEAVSCDKIASSTLRSQQSCCNLALELTGLPFSWCPVTAIDEASGDCSQCTAHPCDGLPTRTPTSTQTPTPTQTPTGIALGRCSESVHCDPSLFPSIGSQQACCDLVLANSSVNFSWCPAEAIDTSTGQCSQCVESPCDGVPTPTASPVPT